MKISILLHSVFLFHSLSHSIDLSYFFYAVIAIHCYIYNIIYKKKKPITTLTAQREFKLTECEIQVVRFQCLLTYST